MKLNLYIVIVLFLLSSCIDDSSQKQQVYKRYREHVESLQNEKDELYSQYRKALYYSPLKVNPINVTEDSTIDSAYTEIAQNRLGNIYSISKENFREDPVYFKWALSECFTNSWNYYQETPYNKALVKETLKSDVLLKEIWSIAKEDVKITYRLLKPTQQQATKEFLDSAIIFFKEYDIVAAEKHYNKVVSHRDSIKNANNFPDYWEATELRFTDTVKEMDFVEYDYKGKQRPEGDKFIAQLERGIFKHKVLTPERIVYWLSEVRNYIE